MAKLKNYKINLIEIIKDIYKNKGNHSSNTKYFINQKKKLKKK